jgi:hypothetical protein
MFCEFNCCAVLRVTVDLEWEAFDVVRGFGRIAAWILR